MKKLVIVENNLSIRSGHFRSTPKSIATVYPQYEHHLLGDAQLPSRLLGPILSTDTSLTKVAWPILPGTIRPTRKKIKRQLRLNLGLRATFAKMLLSYFNRMKVCTKDHVLIPSCDIRTLVGVLDTLQQNAQTPTFHIRFIFEEMPFVFVKRYGCERLKAFIDQGRLKIYTETQQHGAILRTKYGIHACGTLIIPCTIYPDSLNTIATNSPRKANSPFTVGIFGGPRPDKGSDRIASIIKLLRALCAEQEKPPSIEFVIQIPVPENTSSAAPYANLRDLPVEQDSVSIRAINTGLSPADFAKYFSSTDAILLPYDAAKHRCQGSGIILDAVFSRIPIIHTKGIAFGEFLDHGNALAGHDDMQLAALVLQLATNPAILTEGCKKAYTYGQEKTRQPPDLEVNPAALLPQADLQSTQIQQTSGPITTNSRQERT